MFNRAVLMGRIANDLEIKTTPSGAEVLSFRLAVDRKYQADKNNRVSDFFNIVAWRSSAQFISRNFSKGKMILVEGELQTRQYTDKNGNNVTVTELVVDSAHFTGERGGNPGGATTPQNEETTGFSEVTETAEEYPF